MAIFLLSALMVLGGYVLIVMFVNELLKSDSSPIDWVWAAVCLAGGCGAVFLGLPHFVGFLVSLL